MISFTTTPNPPKVNPVKKRQKYVDKFHMDIIFSECLALGGYRSTLLLVDVATRYCWIYGMSYFYSTYITSALETFKSDAGHSPRMFHLYFDRKLINGKTLRWIITNHLKIMAPAGCKYSNGLTRCT